MTVLYHQIVAIKVFVVIAKIKIALIYVNFIQFYSIVENLCYFRQNVNECQLYRDANCVEIVERFAAASPVYVSDVLPSYRWVGIL